MNGEYAMRKVVLTWGTLVIPFAEFWVLDLAIRWLHADSKGERKAPSQRLSHHVL